MGAPGIRNINVRTALVLVVSSALLLGRPEGASSAMRAKSGRSCTRIHSTDSPASDTVPTSCGALQYCPGEPGISRPPSAHSQPLVGSPSVRPSFFNDTATTEIYTLSLHAALPISAPSGRAAVTAEGAPYGPASAPTALAREDQRLGPTGLMGAAPDAESAGAGYQIPDAVKVEQQPFWSPDSRSVGYFTNMGRTIKTVSSKGGQSSLVCDISNLGFVGAAVWTNSGEIIFDLWGGD